ncbi:MAG TPA: hypothetical protein VF683_05505 [Chthoniobacterales bacterium]
MKRLAALAASLLLTSCAHFSTKPEAPNDFRQLPEATPLATALDRAFQFRKTKLFLLGDAPGAQVQTGMFRGAARDPAVGFEGAYRLHGAVTSLDQRQRFGHYFDFFWRAKRDAKITVRLEYRQAKLRAFTQAREVEYPRARGSHKTSFAITGDDFWNDGHVIAWRCLLIENGRIVAEDRSYLWR